VHRKIAELAEHHQDNDERECSDQILKKDGTAKPCIENDLTTAGSFQPDMAFDSSS
jgi:hypothetical protein